MSNGFYTTAGENRRIYREVFNASTYGTSFYETRINTTTLALSLSSYSGFNTVTNVGTDNVAPFGSFTPVTNQQINYTALTNGSEFRCVMIRQGTATNRIIQLRPQNKPTWWDENLWSYIFIVRYLGSFNELFSNIGGLARTPYSSIDVRIRPKYIAGLLPDLRRTVETGCVLGSYQFANGGFIGTLSNTFVQADTSNATAGSDIIVVSSGVEEYLVIYSAPNTEGGLCGRIV